MVIKPVTWNRPDQTTPLSAPDARESWNTCNLNLKLNPTIPHTDEINFVGEYK